MKTAIFLLCAALLLTNIAADTTAEADNKYTEDSQAKCSQNKQHKSLLNREKQLITTLLNRYKENTVYGKPITDAKGALNISLGLSLVRFDYDLDREVLHLNAWERLKWTDDLLKWNAEEYDGIEQIVLSANDIWIPDILLFNSAEQEDDTLARRRNLPVVKSSGQVTWVPQLKLHANCPLQRDDDGTVKEEQSCTLTFMSWSYHGWELGINRYDEETEVQTLAAVENNKWEVVNTRAEENVVVYDCCPEPVPDVRFTFNLRRRKSKEN